MKLDVSSKSSFSTFLIFEMSSAPGIFIPGDGCEALLEKNRSSKINLILEKLKTGQNLPYPQNLDAKLTSTRKYFKY